MELTGLHILLTYSCNFECDHCFVWGSPDQEGTFNVDKLETVFEQALEVQTIETIYFEGGEPFLFFPLLQYGVTLAHALGFSTGIVSNGYWAADFATSLDMLRPLAAAGLNHISISSDGFHLGVIQDQDKHPGVLAARQLGLTADVICIDPPVEPREVMNGTAGEPVVGGGVMFRGRAAENLTADLPRRPWSTFDDCPHELLDHPSRLHLDPFGNLHLCQGILLGNLFELPLKQIVDEYTPAEHPIVGPLLQGGPAGLARQFQLQTEPGYVDACHMCYAVRKQLRPRFHQVLAPDAMYGVPARPDG